jgi:hypothetical protein
MEAYCTDSLLVETKSLVGFVGEVEIVPEETLDGKLVYVL